MANAETSSAGFGTDVDLRRRNRAAVADYMSRKGENRLTRYLLFTSDGSAGLYTSDTGEPIVSQGRARFPPRVSAAPPFSPSTKKAGTAWQSTALS